MPHAIHNGTPEGRGRRPKLDPVKGSSTKSCEPTSKLRASSGARIFERIRQERSELAPPAESTVRHYVCQRRQELGLARRETFVPQTYDWGQEAQVDWYEAECEIAGERHKAWSFTMRSMASGGAFLRAYFLATQQAFLEALELALATLAGCGCVSQPDTRAPARLPHTHGNMTGVFLLR